MSNHRFESEFEKIDTEMADGEEKTSPSSLVPKHADVEPVGHDKVAQSHSQTNSLAESETHDFDKECPVNPTQEVGQQSQRLLRKTTKSVSFHSSASVVPDERRIACVADCWRWMVTGSNLVKIRPNARTYHRYFSLDSDLSVLRWTPTSKKASKALVPVDSIREVRAGKTTDPLRCKELMPHYSSDCAFSIFYGENFETLDLVAPSPEEANIWVTGLNALIGSHQASTWLEEKNALRERWLKHVFEKATAEQKKMGLDFHNENSQDGSGNGVTCDNSRSDNMEDCLDQSAAMALLKELSGDVALSRIRQKLVECDLHKVGDERGRIDSREFIELFQEIATRPEIYFLLIRFTNKDYLTLDDLHLFLEGEQGMIGVSQERCLEIINEFEPNPEARKNQQLLIDGFTKYLLSEEGDLFDSTQKRMCCQDMTHPLAHYFISTSHNTYLLEDQLRGPSSVEGYIRALQYGCRCVKVDCWDGTDGPVVCHGNTLTTKIAFSDVIETIADYAFESSEYPLILHLENHCSVKQQRTVAEILCKTLGSMLYTSESLTAVAKMSPEDLRGKVVIMGKKLAGAEDEGDVSDEDEGAETSRRKGTLKKFRLARELSDLVSIVRSNTADLAWAKEKQTYYLSYSVNEAVATRLVTLSAENLVEHTKNYLMRVFPSGSRVDSSNFNPQDFWNCGVQMVALNFQTPGPMMDLYDGRFRQNGGCGYVLKPAVMRESISVFSPLIRDPIPGIAPQLLRLKIISGQQLPRPRGSSPKATVIDPYVLVQIFGIPGDCVEAKTRTVSNEGDCPIFDESFEFHVNMPELALVRFVVLDDDYIGDDFIGQNTLPLECLQQGYRHVRLLSNLGEPLENASLFVHVAITNKRGGKLKLGKHHSNIRSVGIRQVDEAFKAAGPVLSEACKARVEADLAMAELRAECGLAETANVKQCLRVLLQRLSASPEVHNFSLQDCNGFPTLSVQSANLSSPLQRSIVCLERAITECKWMAENVSTLVQQLQDDVNHVTELYSDLDHLCHQAGLRGKKATRTVESYAWNVRVLRGQIELLESCKKECLLTLEQVRSSAPTVESLSTRLSKDKPVLQPRLSSPAVEDHTTVASHSSHVNSNTGAAVPSSISPSPNPTSNTTSHPTLTRSPTSPGPLLNIPSPEANSKPTKSILKKSLSSFDTNGQGYVPPPSPSLASASAVSTASNASNISTPGEQDVSSEGTRAQPYPKPIQQSDTLL